VNELRGTITPRIQKKIAEAFNKVRHRRGKDKVVKWGDRIELIYLVDELRNRHAIMEVEQLDNEQRREWREKVKQAQRRAAVDEQAMHSATAVAERRATFLTDVAVPFRLERDACGRAVIHRPCDTACGVRDQDVSPSRQPCRDSKHENDASSLTAIFLENTFRFTHSLVPWSFVNNFPRSKQGWRSRENYLQAPVHMKNTPPCAHT
jgi:hypothetical protein